MSAVAEIEAGLEVVAAVADLQAKANSKARFGALRIPETRADRLAIAERAQVAASARLAEAEPKPHVYCVCPGCRRSEERGRRLGAIQALRDAADWLDEATDPDMDAYDPIVAGIEFDTDILRDRADRLEKEGTP